MLKIIRLQQPQDNESTMKNRSRTQCTSVTALKSPLRLEWKSLGEDVVYNYLIGVVDCIKHVYHAGSVVNAQTTKTDVTLDLPPSPKDQVYSLHIFAEKAGRRIGRLSVNDEAGWEWNYDFRIVNADPH